MLHEIAHAAGAMHNLSYRADAGEMMIDGDIRPDAVRHRGGPDGNKTHQLFERGARAV
jgi:hypothetical protein